MKKKQEEERPDWEIGNVGLMLFTSLMIILLAFFIMLSSMAVVDEKRKLEAYGSLVGAFGILPGGLSPSNDNGHSLAPQTNPLDVVKNDMEHIRDVLAERVMEDKVQFLRGRSKDIIRIEAAALFQQDGVNLQPEMIPVLLKVAAVLKDSDYPVILEGHTDDQPPQNEAYKDNWHISALRATSVLRLFLTEGKLDPGRLSAFGYAGFKPAVANNSPRNRARNNRIDIILDKSRSQALKQLEKQNPEDKILDFKGFYFRLSGK